MRRLSTILAPWLVVSMVGSVVAATYRAEVLSEPAPKDELSSTVFDQLAPQGIRIIRGTKTQLCDVWFCKELKSKAGDLEPNVNYALTPGQLVGVVRFHRDGADIRDQEIVEGVYTMRYALQPVDGDHVGTFPTRDFLLLLRAEDDQEAAPLEDSDELNELSAAAADTSHPASWPLLKVANPLTDPVGMRHDEENDWWILRVHRDGAGDGQIVDLEIVVVGVVEE